MRDLREMNYEDVNFCETDYQIRSREMYFICSVTAHVGSDVPKVLAGFESVHN